MKVVISDYVWPNIDIEKKFFESKNIDLVVSNNKSDLKKQLVDADGLLFCFESIDEDVLRSSKNLKVAQRYGIGVDNIDILHNGVYNGDILFELRSMNSIREGDVHNLYNFNSNILWNHLCSSSTFYFS